MRQEYMKISLFDLNCKKKNLFHDIPFFFLDAPVCLQILDVIQIIEVNKWSFRVHLERWEVTPPHTVSDTELSDLHFLLLLKLMFQAELYVLSLLPWLPLFTNKSTFASIKKKHKKFQRKPSK